MVTRRYDLDESTREKLGRELRDLRHQCNLTLAQCADECGVSISLWSLLENGRCNLSRAFAQRIDELFHKRLPKRNGTRFVDYATIEPQVPTRQISMRMHANLYGMIAKSARKRNVTEAQYVREVLADHFGRQELAQANRSGHPALAD